MTNDFKFNSQIRPKGFPHHFDAHVYFSPETVAIAQTLKSHIECEFAAEISEGSVFVGQIIPKPVGPHPLPMLEVNFAKEQFGVIIPWLMNHRKNLDVLVHSISEDDFYDHTQGAMWLGNPVKLDLSRF
jgi:aromatic ring-cleaving dioxygenase